ncbi:hypothetical protein OC835_003920 [Tilletia horrida]|nr:hypothetical protein OC835_003920 [Tilletia horrida]
MPSNVFITQFEPVVFMRGGSGRDARGRARPLNTSVSPSHVRALLTLELQKACKIRDIQVSFSGVTHTDWPEGIGPNRLELAESTQIFKNIVTIWSAKEEHALSSLSRRRCNSIGPGAIGAPGDEDWSTLNHAASSSAAGAGAVITDTGPSTVFSGGGGSSSSGGGSSGGVDAHTLARSIAGVAARAGTAIMPATIRNELVSARKSKSGSGSTKDAAGGGGGGGITARPSLGRQWSAGSSPTRAGSSLLPRGFGSNASSSSAANISTPRASQTSAATRQQARFGTEADVATPTARAPNGISDPPPTYDEVATPPAAVNRLSSYFDQQHSSSSPGDLVQSPGILQHTSSPSRLRSPAAVHFNSNANGEHHTAGNLSFARAIDRSTTPTMPPSPSSSSSFRAQGQAADEEGKSRILQLRTVSSDRKAGNGIISGTGSIGTSEGRPRKAGAALKNLIGGLLLAEKNEDDACTNDWKLFKPGVYQFPVTVQLPSDLPPTLHADFGHNAYHLRALVRRVGALTSNLMAEHEVTLIHSPEDDGTTDATDLIVVQRTWEDALAYMVVISGRTFPIQASTIPVWMKLAPLDKVHVHRITASIEERTSYFAKNRTTARHEVPRRWQLLKLAGEDLDRPLLPIVSEASDALERSPLVPYAPKGTGSNGEPDEDAVSALLDHAGPWELYLDLPLPTSSTAPINISTSHVKANVQVAHTLRVSLRVGRAAGGLGGAESGSGGKAKQFDIIIEAPITLTHSHTAEEWVSLPSYGTLGATVGGADGTAATGDGSDDADRPSTAFGTGMARSASSSSSHRSPLPSPPIPISGSASAQKQRVSTPRVPAPSPVAMRMGAGVLGSGSGANPPRARTALIVAHSNSNADSSASAPYSSSSSPSSRSPSSRPSSSSGPAGAEDAAAARARASMLTNRARELSRQWLALSSAGVQLDSDGAVGSSSDIGRGGGESSQAHIGLAGPPPSLGGGPPPPDYRSAVQDRA